MDKIFKKIDDFSERFGDYLSYLNILVVVIVCWEIVARYVFNAPTIWASEGMVMVSGFMYVLAGGYAQRDKRHVRIDMLYTKLSPRGKGVSDALSYVFFCIFMYALIIHGGFFAYESIKIRETTGTPWDPIIYPIKLAVPVGAFFLWLQMTADVVRNLRASFGPRKSS